MKIKYYFRILNRNNFKYYYYKKIPNGIYNNSKYLITKINEPINIYKLTDYKNINNLYNGKYRNKKYNDIL
jgi:hypothetical protein